jgi:hypothetical protein
MKKTDQNSTTKLVLKAQRIRQLTRDQLTTVDGGARPAVNDSASGSWQVNSCCLC